MDAAYLRKHVQGALSQALLAMAIQQPEDSVEFVGQYLLEYVRRDEEKRREEQELKEATELAQIERDRLQLVDIERRGKQIEQDKYVEQLAAYLRELPDTGDSKQAAMDSATEFLADYLKVPAAYVAVKRTVEENEVLYYMSSNGEQRARVVGKTLAKAEFNEDEPVYRQGLTFDAFIVPEEPEVEVDPEDENFVPPPPPTAQPKLVENTMRERRVKFFGIPQLGSFLAVPLRFESVDHEEGCKPEEPSEESEAPAEGAAPGEEEAAEGAEQSPAAPAKKRSAYAMNRLPVELVVCVDTVGKYRPLTAQDTAVVSAVGAALVERLVRLETASFTAHEGFLESMAQLSGPVAEALSKLPAEEEQALEAVVRELSKKKEPVSGEGEEAPAEGEEGEAEAAAEEEAPEEELPESLKPYKDAAAVLGVWSRAFLEGPLGPALSLLQDHVLPAPAPVRQLVRLAALLTGASEMFMKDTFGEVTWDALRMRIVPSLAASIGAFDPAVEFSVPAAASLEALKAAFDEAGLADAAAYPAHLFVVQHLATWLNKAFEARAAAKTYFSEVLGKEIETVF